MTGAPPLRRVLVAGGGTTGWCAAAALKRRAPFLDVTLLACEPSADALADRIACVPPSLPGFHADLGIGEEDGVLRIGAGYRLGTLFAGWAEGLPDYVHAYGGYGRPIGTSSFHVQWARAAKGGTVAPFDAHSAAAMLARAGRFMPRTPQPPFADHDYGLTLDGPRHRAMIRAFALHVGVREVSGEVAAVEQDERGFITLIRTHDGKALAADLFVDATGPEARLRDRIDTARDDWRRWLPCDRVLLRDGEATEPLVLTHVAAHAAGWRWTSGAQQGVAFASDHLDTRQADTMLPGAASITIRPGTRPQPWRANCVAIGDAATAMEPLEWCNLHLALSAVDRLVTMLPDADMAPVEIADFNRQTLAEAERVRDFVAMHYHVARRPEPMWRALIDTAPPPSLALTLDQFASRGRLPFHEEETFGRDSWAAVLIGQGFLPRRIDPLADAVPAAQAQAMMAGLATEIAAAVPHAPTHAAWLAAQTRRLAR